MSLDIKQNKTLSDLTTIHLGGAASHYVRCRSVDEIREALKIAQERGWSIHVLGGGSNTIFSDEGFAGLVIHVDIRGIDFSGSGVTVAAGEVWDDFVVQCIENNLAGVECLSGIPGLVGATPMQNVGAYGQEVAQTITRVHALDRQTLEAVEFTNEECEFSYRHSRFKGRDKDRYIITKVTFRLTPNGAPTIAYPELAALVGTSSAPSLTEVREAVLTLRRKKSMVVDPADPNTRSCGSFFTNPIITREQFSNLTIKQSSNGDASEIPSFPVSGSDDAVKVPAAYLIEGAGFKKGERRGGVGISTNHVLALVNYGGTAKELLGFADEIKTTVKEKFGIELQQEPVTVQRDEPRGTRGE